eukprot:219999-Chlamydomonas_euryale.AAC.1
MRPRATKGGRWAGKKGPVKRVRVVARGKGDMRGRVEGTGARGMRQRGEGGQGQGGHDRKGRRDGREAHEGPAGPAPCTGAWPKNTAHEWRQGERGRRRGGG